MSKKPINTGATAGAAAAAAGFADGHVDTAQGGAPIAATAGAALSYADPLEALREADRVNLTDDVLSIGATPAYILIVCGTPGFRRGGLMHPARAEYPLDSFTQDQLDAFEAEPRLEVVTVGGSAIPRATRFYGVDPLVRVAPYDPRLAGDAAAAAISDPPNRSAPGLRNAVAGDGVAGFGARG